MKKRVALLILHEFYELITESTSHGLPRIFARLSKKQWALSIFWMITFLAALVYCVYTIIQCMVIYFQFGVTLEISQIQELPTKFPAITICNINPFMEAFAHQYLVNKMNQTNCFNSTSSFLSTYNL